ncbi:gentisate 1,2-dioxygenase [Rugamonas sp. FT82W]|uniref:Gentisate 1,2-dioxygenase n=1 Tax=Duganella vulcania TaxID=2692166 RepID=A0A845FUX7_9BURK|nr:gentisate 1,2-dioxygenase [Duganella vulcania]MYM85884.1 gentisate 1,2-dioxygenase [Duganella vulcania]
MKHIEHGQDAPQQPLGIVPTVDLSAEPGRQEFYQRADGKSLAPLWRVLHGLVTATPQPPCTAAQWKYREVRPFLMEACEQISTAEAERRVLVLENPSLRGQSRITQSLFCGLQIILPGEVAPPHRHVASALRFIVEGRDAYTAVGGERTTMEAGDFVITPSMTWHDHGNESDAPMVWVDGLDMHIVNMMAASFRDSYPAATHPLVRPEGAAAAEFGSNLLPIDHQPGSLASPIFNYPYRATREALHRYARAAAPDAWHGYKMKYINPVTGGWAMPTISTWLQHLPKGLKTAPYRATDSTVLVVVEGSGTTRIGDQHFSWQPHDILVIPSWVEHQHCADGDAVLFGYSDRVVQEKLGFWREEKING